MAGGYAPGYTGMGGQDYLQQLLAQQAAGVPFVAAGTPAPAPVAAQAQPQQESPASLIARYGNAPETVDQWTRMNGFQPAQGVSGLGGANPLATPLGPSGPMERPGQPVTPSGPAPASPPSGGNPYLDAINAAWDAQTKLADANIGRQFQGAMGRRGILPSDGTAQDNFSQIMSPIYQQLGAGRAGDIAGAIARQQEDARAQRDAEENRRRWEAEQAWRNDERTYQRQRDTLQQQWATEDRNRQLQAMQQAQAGGVGSGGPQPSIGEAWSGALSGGGSGGGFDSSATEQARALILGGSGGVRPGTSSGVDTPMTPGGFSMGGGAGVGGAGTGFNTGFGEKTDWHLNKPKPWTPGGSSTTTTPGTTTPGASTQTPSWRAGATNPGTAGIWNNTAPAPNPNPLNYNTGSTFRTGGK